LGSFISLIIAPTDFSTEVLQRVRDLSHDLDGVERGTLLPGSRRTISKERDRTLIYAEVGWRVEKRNSQIVDASESSGFAGL
jgi:hypothetical protein